MSQSSTVLVEYTLSEKADVVDVEAHIADFVGSIRALDAGITYVSHRRVGAPRTYAHVGLLPDDRAKAAIQSAPFLGVFSAYLKTVTVEAPRVTWLEVVATTQGG